MVERILFVCTANICRSPSAQAIALHRLRADGLSGQITVVSAGTRAAEGRSWCREARKHVSTDAETRAAMEGHEAHQLSFSGIAKATLVVTADRQTSAEVVRLDPQVRSRLFTMREAGALAQLVVDSGLVHAGTRPSDAAYAVRPLTADTDPAARLQWLADEMDAGRGQVSFLTERRKRHLFRTERVPVLDVDIADAHAEPGGRGSHRRNLPSLTSSVGQLMTNVSYVLGRPAP
jgi:low molecular weight protein-tyrosine phosphatase